jgi:hypothetical protein
MKEILLKYLNLLWNTFQFDFRVFSEELWIYYWLCVPAMVYLSFFIIKWIVLTAPFWIPISLISNSFLSTLKWFVKPHSKN